MEIADELGAFASGQVFVEVLAGDYIEKKLLTGEVLNGGVTAIPGIDQAADLSRGRPAVRGTPSDEPERARSPVTLRQHLYGDDAARQVPCAGRVRGKVRHVEACVKGRAGALGR